MSYSRTTENFELPQYNGTDKPTVLSDFNLTMVKIDTALADATADAAAANVAAQAAEAAAANAEETAEGAATDASSALTRVGNLETNVDGIDERLTVAEGKIEEIGESVEAGTITIGSDNWHYVKIGNMLTYDVTKYITTRATEQWGGIFVCSDIVPQIEYPTDFTFDEAPSVIISTESIEGYSSYGVIAGSHQGTALKTPSYDLFRGAPSEASFVLAHLHIVGFVEA